MHAVILAAGRGTRLGSLTDDRPKGMVEVAGRPLLAWQHAALGAAGVDAVTVVTGYRGEAIAAHGFRTINNPDWERGNMVSSLACALEAISGPLVVSYADILYDARCVRALMACREPLALTYDRDWLDLWRRRFDEPLSDAETFRLDEAGRVIDIGRQPDSVDEVEGQFMGLLKLEAKGRSWIEEVLAADAGARLALDTTALLGRLIAAGRPIAGVPISGGWCEIDSLRDLAVAEALVGEDRLLVSASK